MMVLRVLNQTMNGLTWGYVVLKDFALAGFKKIDTIAIYCLSKTQKDCLFLFVLEESDEELILKAEITSLKKQLEESEKNWLRQKDALLQDRTLVASENKLQVSKDEAHINLLTARQVRIWSNYSVILLFSLSWMLSMGNDKYLRI